MKPILFLVAGAATFVLDNGIFYILDRRTGLLFLSLAASTAVSVIFNYLVVRRFVFDAKARHTSALPKYLGVHGAGLLIRFAIIKAITSAFHIPNIGAKWVADGIVYSVKYFIQRDFVFKDKPTHSAAPESDQSGWPAAPESIPPVSQPQSESLRSWRRSTDHLP